MDCCVGWVDYCRGTVEMDLEGLFLLIWMAHEVEISADPSLVQWLLSVEKRGAVGWGTGLLAGVLQKWICRSGYAITAAPMGISSSILAQKYQMRMFWRAIYLLYPIHQSDLNYC